MKKFFEWAGVIVVVLGFLVHFIYKEVELLPPQTLPVEIGTIKLASLILGLLSLVWFIWLVAWRRPDEHEHP